MSPPPTLVWEDFHDEPPGRIDDVEVREPVIGRHLGHVEARLWLLTAVEERLRTFQVQPRPGIVWRAAVSSRAWPSA